MTPRTVYDLQEWGTCEVALSDAALTALVGHPQQPVAVEPSAVPGRWKLRAQSKVGAVRFDDFDLVVRPKAGMRNALYLMGVSTMRDWWSPTDLVGLDTDPSLFSAIALLLTKAVHHAISSGVQNDYVEQNERLVALRGRLDIATQLRRPALPVPAACRYDDYTPDTPLNRLLKAAIRRALQLPGVPLQVRRTLLLQQALLGDVANAAPALDWADRWRPTRLDERYRPAVQLASLLLRCLAVAQRAGTVTSRAFLVDMADLFQNFVEEGLRRRLQDPYNGIEVGGQDSAYLDRERRLLLRPDVVIKSLQVPVFVVDAKYVLHRPGHVEADHQMQVLAYAVLHQLRDVALLYALDPAHVGGSVDMVSTIRHADIRIHSWAVDLTATPTAIEASLDDVAARLTALIGR